MKLRNQLEAEQMEQAQWEMAIEQLKKNREQMMKEHEENMERIKNMSCDPRKESGQAVAWLHNQLGKGTSEPSGDGEGDPHKKARLEHLYKQQEDIQKEIEDISSGVGGNPPRGKVQKDTTEQEILMEQIRNTLAPKAPERDPNRALLRALITAQNKATGYGGTSTLKPELLCKLAREGEFSMAEWLASLNKQEEGESEVHKLLNRLDDDSDCRAECRHTKMKSGMLDKSTTNIRHKEVWPQKNLGEDWAEEEIEFKQLRFEHLVVGETRTIETCDDPAQILGRLRLLRRIAYLKLRGIEWQLLWKMYAAILSSIETREYSWESNFDRFESILYHTALVNRSGDREHKPPEGRKRFCRDYNKPEGCPKSSPHVTWFGTGPSAVKRMVYHGCATCLIRDKTLREHPEGHRDCPHRA